MSIPAIRPATQDDLEYVAHHMREADRMEVAARSGRTPIESLRMGYERSTPHAYAGVDPNDLPMCIFGVVSDPNNLAGAVWLLGTDEIVKQRYRFLRESRGFLSELLERWPLLHNLCDQRNRVHIRWLQWMGFEFHSVVHVGEENLPFYYFSKRNSNV